MLVVLYPGSLRSSHGQSQNGSKDWGAPAAGARLFVTGSQTSHLALKAQESLHLDTRRERSKPRRTNTPVVCGGQHVTRREPHILYCKADALQLRGYHKPNKYCRTTFPEVSWKQKHRGFHLKQRQPCSLCSWRLAFCPILAYHVLDEHRTSSNKITRKPKTI